MADGRADYSAYILTPPSINGERSRWVLDYHGVPFREIRRTLAPASLIPVLLYSHRAQGSPYVYVVGRGGNPVFRNPEKLVEHLDAGFPEDRRLRVSLSGAEREQFDNAMQLFNQNIRPWSYQNVTADRQLFVRIMTAGVPFTQRIFLRLIAPLMRLAVTRTTSWGKPADVLAAVHRAFDASDAMFAGGREFVTGGRLTYADIALGVNAAPAIMPAQYGGGGIFPPLDELPPDLREMVAGFRARPTGRYVLNLFQHHRLPAGSE